MIRWSRLVRDDEHRIDVSQAMILAAMGSNLLRRNAHTCFPEQALKECIAPYRRAIRH
jgi:hypothetical protein